MTNDAIHSEIDCRPPATSTEPVRAAGESDASVPRYIALDHANTARMLGKPGSDLCRAIAMPNAPREEVRGPRDVLTSSYAGFPSLPENGPWSAAVAADRAYTPRRLNAGRCLPDAGLRNSGNPPAMGSAGLACRRNDLGKLDRVHTA